MSELQALLDAAVDAIVLVDSRVSITTFNAAAERLFGYRADEVVGKPVDMTAQNAVRPAIAKLVDYLRSVQRSEDGRSSDQPAAR